MHKVPKDIQLQFKNALSKKQLPNLQEYYQKWLRYYYDFCHKYNHPLFENQSLVPFIEKLKEKKQTKSQKPFSPC